MDKGIIDAATECEEPVFFPAGAETLFGVLSRPISQGTEPAVVLVGGGWYGTSSGRNRIMIRIARRLTSAGHSVFRFDYHGVGESTGSVTLFDLDRPFAEDLEAAVAFIKDRGLTECALVGVCFGARTILEIAPELGGLRGAVLVSPPVRSVRDEIGRPTRRSVSMWKLVIHGLRPWVLRDLLDSDRRRYYGRVLAKTLRHKQRKLLSRGRSLELSREGNARGASAIFLESINRLLERQIPLLLIYGRSDTYFQDFQAERMDGLGEVLEKGAGLVDLRVVDGEAHALGRMDLQDQIIDTVCDWMRDRFRAGTEIKA